MNIGVVTSICKSQGMSSVCLASGCVFNPPDCRVTPLSTNCNIAMTGLSKKICNDWAPDYCKAMDGLFTDHLSSLSYGTKGQGACGIMSNPRPSGHPKGYCVSGDDYVSSKTKPLYAYCVL